MTLQWGPASAGLPLLSSVVRGVCESDGRYVFTTTLPNPAETVPQGVTTPPADEEFSELDYAELRILRQLNLGGELDGNEVARTRLAELDQRLRRYVQKQDAAFIEEWSKGLTKARVKALERRLAAGEELSGAEHKQLVAAQELSKPRTNDDATWDRWYRTPIAETLFPRVPCPHNSRRRARPRGRRVVRPARSRSPGRQQDSDPEPEPEHVVARPCGGAW